MNRELKYKFVAPFRGFLLAFSFLTRLPLRLTDEPDAFTWKWSTAFYPACGYFLGVLAVSPLFLTIYFLPAFNNISLVLVSVFYYVGLLEWMTRMLHLDGFCDCCDAFSAMGVEKADRLEIMKDPHVGSAALGGTVLLLGGKVFSLYLLAQIFTLSQDSVYTLIPIFIAIPVFGRFAMLCLAAIGKYPRKSGTGLNIIGRVPVFSLLFAAITLIPLLLYIPLASLPLCFFFGAFVIFYWKIKADNKIGGITGDVLGACCQTGELAMAFAFLISMPHA